MASYIRRTYEPLKFLGRLFFVPLSTYGKVRVVSATHTWEAESPYRWGPTVVVRVPLTNLALGVGIWLDSQVSDLEAEAALRKEQEAADAAFDAYQAVNGRVSRTEWDKAREEIAKLGLDPDEEMIAMQERGLFE